MDNMPIIDEELISPADVAVDQLDWSGDVHTGRLTAPGHNSFTYAVDLGYFDLSAGEAYADVTISWLTPRPGRIRTQISGPGCEHKAIQFCQDHHDAQA